MLKKINGYTSPIWKSKRISSKIKVDLKVKRDDLIPFFGGGNKVRKMVPIVRDAKRDGADAIVTAGGKNSNHLRVFSLVSAYLGWHCSAIVHSESLPQPDNNANYQLVDISGADIQHCSLSEAPERMDAEMERLREAGFNPYYVWGGGHTPEGVKAYVDAVYELAEQLQAWVPDYIVVASGTGGTHSGIHIGASEVYERTKVIGISVARDKKRGVKKLRETIKMYSSQYGKVDCRRIKFLDEYSAGGYEKLNKRIAEVVKKSASDYGLVLDPVYTGKAFAGLLDLIEKGAIEEKSKVLFWHTGGEFNLIPISKMNNK
jgi:D-cysteine desulfhydrase